MSLDVSRAAVIGGAVVEATLGNTSLFFFFSPISCKNNFVFHQLYFSLFFPDRRQVHPCLAYSTLQIDIQFWKCALCDVKLGMDIC